MRLNVLCYYYESRVWETLTLTKSWYQAIEKNAREIQKIAIEIHWMRIEILHIQQTNKQTSRQTQRSKTKWYRQSPLQTSAIQGNESFNVWLELSIKLLYGETTAVFAAVFTEFITVPSISKRSTIVIRATRRKERESTTEAKRKRCSESMKHTNGKNSKPKKSRQKQWK